MRSPSCTTWPRPKRASGSCSSRSTVPPKKWRPWQANRPPSTRNLDTFFTAWASVAPSLEQTIVEGPPALHQAIYSLPFQAEFVNKSADFMRLLRPSAKILTTVAAPLGHAFEVGAVNVRAAHGA